MIELPIDSVMREGVEGVRGHGGVVVVAAAGEGERTRGPVGLMRGLMGGGAGGASSAGEAGIEGAIVMLQPRRVAARAAAERMAAENGWRVGEEVGYHIRF